eukprot:1133621-Karenia_brevis.AAC.1
MGQRGHQGIFGEFTRQAGTLETKLLGCSSCVVDSHLDTGQATVGNHGDQLSWRKSRRGCGAGGQGEICNQPSLP